MSGILSGTLSLGQMTPAAQFGLAGAMRRVGSMATRGRKRRAKKTASSYPSTRKKKRKAASRKMPAKGSAAMKRRMARLRAMRRK